MLSFELILPHPSLPSVHRKEDDHRMQDMFNKTSSAGVAPSGDNEAEGDNGAPIANHSALSRPIVPAGARRHPKAARFGSIEGTAGNKGYFWKWSQPSSSQAKPPPVMDPPSTGPSTGPRQSASTPAPAGAPTAAPSTTTTPSHQTQQQQQQAQAPVASERGRAENFASPFFAAFNVPSLLNPSKSKSTDAFPPAPHGHGHQGHCTQIHIFFAH